MKRTKDGMVLLYALAALLSLVVSLVWWIVGHDAPPFEAPDLAVVREDVPADENAYTYFAAVSDRSHKGIGSRLLSDLISGKTNDESLVAAILSSNAAALALVEQGTRCRVCQMPAVTNFATPMPYVSNWMTAGKVLALKAAQQRGAGQFVESATTCITLLRFGDLTTGGAGTIIEYLVGLGILELGLAQSRRLALTPEAAERDLAVMRQTVAALHRPEDGFARALKGEYRCAAATTDDMANRRLSLGDLSALTGEPLPRPGRTAPIPRYVLQPNRTKALFAEMHRAGIRDASRPYAERKPLKVEEMSARTRSQILLAARPNSVGHVLVALIAPATDSLFAKKCQTDASIAATRLILACRAYKADFEDSPPTLEALVPKYIERVPADPFDGKPFRYSKEKAILYSVGKDLIDQGGSEKPVGPHWAAPPPAVPDRWRAEDIVFRLEGMGQPVGEWKRAEGKRSTP